MQVFNAILIQNVWGLQKGSKVQVMFPLSCRSRSICEREIVDKIAVSAFVSIVVQAQGTSNLLTEIQALLSSTVRLCVSKRVP
jgi:hypothetical protein